MPTHSAAPTVPAGCGDDACARRRARAGPGLGRARRPRVADPGRLRRRRGQGRRGAPCRGGADRAAVLRRTRATGACSGRCSTSSPTTVARRSWPWPTGADVIIESFRPGVVDRLGIGFDAVRGTQPRHRLLLHVSGFGQTGPRSVVGRPRRQLPGRRRVPRLHRSPGRRPTRAARCDGGRHRRGWHAGGHVRSWRRCCVVSAPGVGELPGRVDRRRRRSR